MLSLLLSLGASLIPKLLGFANSSILQKVIDALAQHQDTQLEEDKLKTQVVIEKLQQDVEIKKLQEDLLKSDSTQFYLWFPRAMLYWSVCTYVSLIFFVSAFNIPITVLHIPTDLDYIVYAVVGMMTLQHLTGK